MVIFLLLLIWVTYFEFYTNVLMLYKLLNAKYNIIKDCLHCGKMSIVCLNAIKNIDITKVILHEIIFLALSISLVANALFIGYITYDTVTNESVSSAVVQSLTENVPSESLEEVITAFGEFVGAIASENADNTVKIPVADAIQMHKHYYDNRANQSVDTTRAIQFSMPVLIRAIYDGSIVGGRINSNLFLDNLVNSSFYVYLAKYNTQNSAHTNNTTAIIQLANNANGDVLLDQIFNFGRVCPTVCPQNGQIEL